MGIELDEHHQVPHQCGRLAGFSWPVYHLDDGRSDGWRHCDRLEMKVTPPLPGPWLQQERLIMDVVAAAIHVHTNIRQRVRMSEKSPVGPPNAITLRFLPESTRETGLCKPYAIISQRHLRCL